jgi:bifunctional N-acetylglucosamine-1-phosphate-uridyltransferase/glucosamine-1-phosphate-acetyltransferase GlmU-like protein
VKSQSRATLMIPCAGMGTRLGSGFPKCLTEISPGVTILRKILLETIQEFTELVIVVSPSGFEYIEGEIVSLGKVVSLPPVKYAIQRLPIGSLNAVNTGLALCSSSKSVVVWGDQVGVKRSTIKCVLESLTNSQIVVPVTLKRRPYVWFTLSRRDLSIKAISRVRDGDRSPFIGITDLGVFGINSNARHMINNSEKSITNSGVNRELDLLYTFALYPITRLTKLIFRLNFGQTLAINTLEDLTHVKRRLN